MSLGGGAMTPKAFHALFGRIGARAKMPFPIYPHMLRHDCGYALANAGHNTRALQAHLGHKNIHHTVRSTELAPNRSRTVGDRVIMAAPQNIQTDSRFSEEGRKRGEPRGGTIAMPRAIT
jgi:site-specific recombinase XerD